MAEGTKICNEPKTILTCFENVKKSGMVNFKKIVVRALKFLQSREYEQLFNYIEEVLPTENMKSEFFFQEGHYILKHDLVYSNDMVVLEWIRCNFSKVSIQNTLCYQKITGKFLSWFNVSFCIRS